VLALPTLRSAILDAIFREGVPMASRKDTVSEMFRSVVTALWACENTHEGHVQIVCTRGMQKGSLKVRARLCDTADGRIAGVRTQVEVQYPSSDSVTFEGALLKLVLRLDNEESKRLPLDEA
jgi:hypothetical protein